MGWFSSSSRTQGTVATPKPFPTWLLLAAIVVALAAWGLGVFLVAARRHALVAAQADAGLRLPADFRVLAAGGYRGRDLGFSLGRNGNRASQFDVIVNSPGKPVALMLGAYDPTIWNLSSTPGTRIVAVYVGGYEPQSLAASLGNVPVLVSSYEQHTPCPYFYLGGEGRPTIDAAARRVFGRPVDQVYSGGEDGSIFVGPGGPLVR